MNHSIRVLLLMVSVAISACAIPQQLELIEREQRRLRTEISTIRAENTAVRAENAAIREELQKIRSSMADAHANLQQIQRELGALRGQLEEARFQVNRQIGETTREKDQRIKELESRVAKIDEDLKAQRTLLRAEEEELRALREQLLRTPLPGKESEAPGAGGLAREKVPGESDAARVEYEEALKLLERKDYRTAIARFRDFLKKYPNSEYADNAQYWIGESYYAMREFDQAILEFDAVRQKYPKGDKVPAALLKLAFAFAELGDKVDARLILQELINRYPQSPEAAKAKEKLKALQS